MTGFTSWNRRAFLRQCGALCCGGIGLSLNVRGETSGEEARLAFRPDGDGFAFDTGLLRGTLRQKGRPIGMAPLYYKDFSSDLSQPYGVCSHYRLLDAETRYGVAAWDWSGTAELLSDGSVKALWTRDETHPFDLQAHYRWHAPDVLEVLTTVVAAKPLQKFEVFLASYFNGFADSFVWARSSPAASREATFMKAEQKNGVWQMFPRDELAIKLIQDGRWSRPPHPVNWAIMPFFAAPLAMRRDAETGLVAVVMSRPEDCFAVATPYSGEGHRSLYFSLLGRDLEPERPVTAEVRLIIGHALIDEVIVDRYRQYAGGEKRNA